MYIKYDHNFFFKRKRKIKPVCSQVYRAVLMGLEKNLSCLFFYLFFAVIYNVTTTIITCCVLLSI